MRVLVVGPFEDWAPTQSEHLELRRTGNATEALRVLEVWQPQLVVVDPSVIGSARAELIAMAESIGSRVIASPDAKVRIPGSTLQELERHAILETLEAVQGSTSRAAKILGISVRKIQYRLRGWREKQKEQAQPAEPIN